MKAARTRVAVGRPVALRVEIAPRARALTPAESRRAEIARKSTLQRQLDDRDRCYLCQAVITKADVDAYHAEGAPLHQLPASCTRCAEGP